MARSCARPGCSQSAVATLSYAYADSEVWLEDLTGESHPMTHDLCGMHADSVKVPRGWSLSDVRAGPDGRALDPGLDGTGLRLVGA